MSEDLNLRIAAVIQKEYGLGPDSAPSIVRRVLEMAAAESLAGWSRDEHCPLMKDMHGNNYDQKRP